MEPRNGKRLVSHRRGNRTLLAESLEPRDLLAADMFGSPAGVVSADSVGTPVTVDCAPTRAQDAAHDQQRDTASDGGPMHGQAAPRIATARAQAATQRRDRVTTPDDCQIGDGNEPIQQRGRLHQDQPDDARIRRHDRSTQADRQVGDRLTSRDRDRLADGDTPTTPLEERTGNGRTGRNGSDNRGNGPVDSQIGQRPGVPVVTGELTDNQILGVLQMREEEKLARDVYTALYQEWDVAIFTQIAQAESQHMEAVGGVIERYGLVDPIGGYDVGSFPTQEVQDLYDDLVASGLTSLTEAYQAGATIEDMDIFDLQELQEAGDLPSDVTRVYENLERGSRNHLRAFVGQIEVAGDDYVAQYLTQEEVDLIVSTPIETGRGTGGGGGGRMDRAGRGNADAVGSRQVHGYAPQPFSG